MRRWGRSTGGAAWAAIAVRQHGAGACFAACGSGKCMGPHPPPDPDSTFKHPAAAFARTKDTDQVIGGDIINEEVRACCACRACHACLPV